MKATEEQKLILSKGTEATIWEFLDYRDFLRSFYELKKREKTGFSYRVFSQRTGVQSPNYLKL